MKKMDNKLEVTWEFLDAALKEIDSVREAMYVMTPYTFIWDDGRVTSESVYVKRDSAMPPPVHELLTRFETTPVLDKPNHYTLETSLVRFDRWGNDATGYWYRQSPTQ